MASNIVLLQEVFLAAKIIILRKYAWSNDAYTHEVSWLQFERYYYTKYLYLQIFIEKDNQEDQNFGILFPDMCVKKMHLAHRVD